MATAQPDLTHAEARDAFKAFAKTIGPKAYCDVSLNLSVYQEKDGALRGTIWVDGLTGHGQQFTVLGNTHRQVLARLEAEWATRSDLHAIETIRRMALAIISITADQGECSDAALRAQFDASDIKRYGDKACAQATEMASNGPFSIVSLSGANDVGQAA